MDPYFVIFTVVVASVQANTISRGWGSQPAVNIFGDGNIQTVASGNGTSYFTAEGSAVGDASQPASLTLSTSESSGALESVGVDQDGGVYPVSGDSYLGNSVTGEDAIYNLHNAVIHGGGTSVSVSNSGGGSTNGVGQISGAAVNNPGAA